MSEAPPMYAPGGSPGKIMSKRDVNSHALQWYSLGEIAALDAIANQAEIAAAIGAVNAATGLAVTVERFGPFFTLTFTLTALQLAVTDAAGSGSSASLKLFDFITGKTIVPLGCFQNYTAFAEGAALTGAAGDAAFVMGLGSAAANAGDAALTGTEVDFGAVTGTITLSEGTGTGKKASGAGLNSAAGLDGSASGIDLYLNWSGSAATIDANSTIDVTGTIVVTGMIF